jgi:hypothetical protein
MKRPTTRLIALAALVTASFVGTPAWGRHHHHHQCYAPIDVAPGLYYGCPPGWYVFGPPYSGYARAWYGGFNSIYGYQGARYRRFERSAGTATKPVAPTPPVDQGITPGTDTSH